MSVNTQEKPASIMEWQVGDLRLTAFPEQPLKVQGNEWWEKIVREAPESSTFNRKSGVLSERGPFESGVLSLNIHPLRIDWHLTKVQPNEIPEEEIPTVGGFSDTSESFARLMQKWLERNCPELDRLAFGAILLWPVQSRQAGYERLANYLPNVKFDPEGSSDFMYQINRPRNSNLDIPDLKINRLSKWSVLVYMSAMIKLDAKSYRSVQYDTPEIYACRLDMDINTAADFRGPLPKDKLGKIFEELVAIGQEITKKGDIP